MASAAGAISTAVEGTNTCNFGRRCGTLQVNGVDGGATLISEGLAVRFVCGAASCPKLPRPWCRRWLWVHRSMVPNQPRAGKMPIKRMPSLLAAIDLRTRRVFEEGQKWT